MCQSLGQSPFFIYTRFNLLSKKKQVNTMMLKLIRKTVVSSCNGGNYHLLSTLCLIYQMYSHFYTCPKIWHSNLVPSPNFCAWNIWLNSKYLLIAWFCSVITNRDTKNRKYTSTSRIMWHHFQNILFSQIWTLESGSSCFYSG